MTVSQCDSVVQIAHWETNPVKICGPGYLIEATLILEVTIQITFPLWIFVVLEKFRQPDFIKKAMCGINFVNQILAILLFRIYPGFFFWFKHFSAESSVIAILFWKVHYLSWTGMKKGDQFDTNTKIMISANNNNAQCNYIIRYLLRFIYPCHCNIISSFRN